VFSHFAARSSSNHSSGLFHTLQPAAAATIPLVYFTLCSPQQQQPFLWFISHFAARSSSNHSSALFHILQPAAAATIPLVYFTLCSQHVLNWRHTWNYKEIEWPANIFRIGLPCCVFWSLQRTCPTPFGIAGTPSSLPRFDDAHRQAQYSPGYAWEQPVCTHEEKFRFTSVLNCAWPDGWMCLAGCPDVLNRMAGLCLATTRLLRKMDRLNSHPRLNGFVIQTKLNLCQVCDYADYALRRPWRIR